MSNYNSEFNDRVKYVLSSPGFDDLTIIEPEGWNNDQKELARNEEYDGIFLKFSNNLKFIGNGADYINTVRLISGINAKIKLTKFERHPQTRKWQRSYWGYLEMSSRSVEDNKVAIKFNSGGLEQEIKARENETIEIDRTETMNGQPIEELQTKQVDFEGRRIFLISKWEANNQAGIIPLNVFSDEGNTRDKTTSFPLSLVSKSHEEAQSPLTTSFAGESGGNTGIMILANFDRERTIKVKGNMLTFKTDIVEGVNPGGLDWQWAFFKVCVTVFQNGTSYNLKERRDLFHAGSGSNTLPNILSIDGGQTFQISFEEIFDIDEGDSIAIEFFIKADLKNFIGSRARFSVHLNDFAGKVIVEENSIFPPSNSKFVLLHDLFARFLKIISSKENNLYSEYLGRTELGYLQDGPGADMGVTHGFWIRGFDKLPLSTEDAPNLFKPLTTSLKESLESVMSALNLGMGIEEKNNVERLIIEPKSHFYNNNVTIKLPNQVKKVKRTEAADYYYSGIEIGYNKGAEYSEAQGLDEPNGKTTLTTIITGVKNVYSKVSSFRADSYGKEFARRKPASIDDTLDTQYDDNIWLLDCKKVIGNNYTQRKWQDDFEQAPTGIFSPETADSLRFSPINNFFRHSWVVAGGLITYPTDYIRYGSSTANSQLKTKLIGKPEYAENGNIINSELTRARFIPEWIEFEHECDFGVMQQVFGTTIINGKEIQNFYGLVQFVNENREIERGFLFNLKPNGKGNWKLLKANR